MQLMSNQNAGLSSQGSANTLFEKVLANVSIYSTQGVVKKQNVSIVIGCSCQIDSLLLATRQIDSSFTDFSSIAI
jgi:hypothetical protein